MSKVSDAVATLKTALKNDPAYHETWHSSIVYSIETAIDAATRKKGSRLTKQEQYIAITAGAADFLKLLTL